MPGPSVPAIVVDGVSKTFEVPRERVHTLKERALHPFRRVVTDRLLALDDVSAAIEPGEFFGVVGRNGSGKSTLLKCLAGIYGVDSGRIYVNGQMSTFIELGVGFNMDLAAYDNVVLNATMLGLSPREARRRFDRIIEFAELEEFVELKIKNYSSGMLVRLAFAVMIQVDADILLIDEVLAVGDAAFQQKCFDEFARIRETGTTVVLVTHDMSAVRRFCNRALLLEKGRVVEIGDPEQVGQHYFDLNFSRELSAEPAPDEQRQRHGAEIVDGWLEDAQGQRAVVTNTGHQCALAMRVVFHEPVVDPVFALVIQDEEHRIFMDGGNVHLPGAGRFEAGDEAVVRMSFVGVMAPGRYFVTLGVARPGLGNDSLDRRDAFVSFMVTATAQTSGAVVLPFEIDVTRSTENALR
jgi:ABC-type polysaccharide/polyol phosphate transport system ATPase subunit